MNQPHIELYDERESIIMTDSPLPLLFSLQEPDANRNQEPREGFKSGDRIDEILDKYIDKFQSIMDDLDSELDSHVATEEDEIELSILKGLFKS